MLSRLQSIESKKPMDTVGQLKRQASTTIMSMISLGRKSSTTSIIPDTYMQSKESHHAVQSIASQTMKFKRFTSATMHRHISSLM